MAGDERLQRGSDIRHRIEHHMSQSMIPRELQIDVTAASAEVWGQVHNVLFAPLGPKHLMGQDRLPVDPRAGKVLQDLQREWGTGDTSFPAMLFVPRGTMEFRTEWAMVRPEDFRLTRSELLSTIDRAAKQPDDHWAKSLRFIYAAITGERAPGDDAAPPLKALPAQGKF